MSKHTLGNSFQSVVLRFLSTLDSPRSLTVATLIKYGEWDQVVTLTCAPEQYRDALHYYKAEAATSLLRKCAGLPTTFNLEDIALKSFSAAETQCCKTNARLSHFIHNESDPLDPNDETLFAVIADIRKDVTSLLGELPDVLDIKHGPGATFGDRGGSVSAIHKMSSRPTMTSLASSLLPLWADTAWCRGLMESHDNRSQPKTVKGNRFTTVPKDATKDRGIAIEPSLNVAYQLALGSRIKHVLQRKWWLDLRKGQTLHSWLAREASRKGHLCTIDLSNASDTVSRNLVRLFLPDAWHECLCSLRSPSTQVKGKWHYLEKFSSMGNGFTFELETLIFAAIVRACARQHGITLTPMDFGVYGDDIICPTEISCSVLSALRYFGFTPNPRKTFTKGSFRESCGGDFYAGFDVRAHYVKEEPNDPATWIAFVNGLTRVQDRLADLGSKVSLKAVIRAGLDQLPTPIRTFFGPPELGDLVINTRDESRWNVVVRSSIRYVKVWRPVGRLHSHRCFLPGPLLAGALYGVSSRGWSLRDDIQGYRTGRVAFS
jgi:hypothetical protein